MGKTISKAEQRKREKEIAERAEEMRASFFADKEREMVDQLKRDGAPEHTINQVRKLFAQAASITDDGW